MRLSEFMKPSLYKPLLIGIMVMVFQQFCGINAVLGYCEDIFRFANVKNSSLVSIVTSVTLIVFTMVSCLVVDKCGRRLLLVLGGFFMFIVMFVLGLYFDITVFESPLPGQIDIFNHRTVPVNQISWLAVMCILIFMVMFSLSWGPISWILMTELFPPKAYGMAGAACNVTSWLGGFIVMKFFPVMKSSLRAQGTFWFYAGFSCLSFLFAYFFIPETKGKSLEEIEKYFKSENKNKNSSFPLQEKLKS